MKSSIAGISLAVAVILFFTGFLVLCACPGWYALVAGFAGIAAWRSEGRKRVWAVFWMVASLILTGLHGYDAIGDHRYLMKKKQRIKQMREQGTNTFQRNDAAPH
jgi:hypothetical protein